MKRKKRRIIIIIIFAILIIISGISYLTSYKEEPELSEIESKFNINEYWWISNNQNKKDGIENYNYNYIQIGDVVYDDKGYKLIIDSVKEHSVVLRQEGGLVVANELPPPTEVVVSRFTDNSLDYDKSKSYTISTCVNSASS